MLININIELDKIPYWIKKEAMIRSGEDKKAELEIIAEIITDLVECSELGSD